MLDEQDPEGVDQMLQLNVAALTVLTRLVLPGMRQRRWGRILNVGSVVGYQPGAPRMAVYYATKAYVLSFSRGLARELHGTGVSVTVLSPGPTETAFDDRAGATVDVRYRRAPKMSAAVVARAGYDGILRQATEVIPGLMTKVLAVAASFPRAGSHWKSTGCCGLLSRRPARDDLASVALNQRPPASRKFPVVSLPVVSHPHDNLSRRGIRGLERTG